MDSFKGSYSLQVIEAMGFQYALEMTLSWNFSRIIVEGDSEPVVQALNRVRTYAGCD